ncbi:hypothetical protein BDZ45DRAFT_677242 [Acephala macrosclerotiorum]|nr:hypothetical protein BDZ45DRAFT_677242 [Acephala macrosclerotiorum]
MYNTNSDPGFNLLIWNTVDFQECSIMSQQRRTDISGDYNWNTPNTNLIMMIGPSSSSCVLSLGNKASLDGLLGRARLVMKGMV